MVLELALLALVLFAPGYFLVNALFPARGSLGGGLDPVYRLLLGVVLSVALTVLLGTLLVVLSTGGTVLFLPETLWPALGALTVALFLAGVWRGAYPPLSRRLGRPVPPPADAEELDRSLFAELEAVADRLEAARREAETAKGTPQAAPAQEAVRRLEEEKRRLEADARRLW